MRRIIIILVVGLCAGNVSGKYYPTEFDRLDLSTPEKAVGAFIENYKAGNFFAVYHILDNQAQINLMRYSAVNFSVDNYFRNATREIYYKIYDELSYEYGEQGIYNRPYLFHLMMSYAAENKLLYINFGEYAIIDKTKRNNDNVESYDCILKESVNGKLTFRLTRSIRGKWRVHQVIVPSGNEELYPWSVKEYK